MTREEAIQELQNCKGLIQQDGQDYLDDRDIPLLDMAIEALHREEAEERGYCHRIIPSNVEIVVRCKDCKHYIVEGITTQYGWCHEYKHSVNEDDYCSYGERKK